MRSIFPILTLFTLTNFNCLVLPEVVKATANDDNQRVAFNQNVELESISSNEDAFNSRNPERLASHWSYEGVFTSQLTGEKIVGRAMQ